MYTVNATITDYKGKPIPNANITVTDSTGTPIPVNGLDVVGRTSDAKGKFIIPVAKEDSFVTISYVGYKPLTLPAVAAKNKTQFKLQTEANYIQEVTVTTPRATPQNNTVASTDKVESNNKKYWIIGGATLLLIAIGTGIYFYTKKR